MTKIIITLLIAYAEYLTAAEAHKRGQASRANNLNRVYYLHAQADDISAKRAVMEAMVRVYLSHRRPQAQNRRKNAA